MRSDFTSLLYEEFDIRRYGRVDVMDAIGIKTRNDGIMDKIVSETSKRVPELIRSDLKKIILFGSYARGDYTDESDIDIAVLVGCDRKETVRYKDDLVALSAEMDLKNMVVVNFVCLSYKEFNEKKGYYPYYANIEREGKVIYG